MKISISIFDVIIKVINQVQAYKNILSNIKKEYEFCIGELEKKRLQNDEIENEVKKLLCINITVENLERRKFDLTLQ